MPVEAIGSTLNNSSETNLQSTTLSQEDFLKLFLTELNFQDPLEPIDNREFLAQIAQFAGLEQARQTTESMNNLVFLSSNTQSVDLLGKRVQTQSTANGLSVEGTVTAIRFTPDGTVLTVTRSDGSVDPNVRLSQITLVRQTQP